MQLINAYFPGLTTTLCVTNLYFLQVLSAAEVEVEEVAVVVNRGLARGGGIIWDRENGRVCVEERE